MEGYAKARELLIEAIRSVMEDEVSIKDLAVSKVLRRPLPSYDRATAHVSVAIRMAERGKTVKAGRSWSSSTSIRGTTTPLCRPRGSDKAQGEQRHGGGLGQD